MQLFYNFSQAAGETRTQSVNHLLLPIDPPNHQHTVTRTKVNLMEFTQFGQRNIIPEKKIHISVLIHYLHALFLH